MAIKSAGEVDPYYSKRQMQKLQQRNLRYTRTLNAIKASGKEMSLQARFRRPTEASAEISGGGSLRASDPWKSARGIVKKYM